MGLALSRMGQSGWDFISHKEDKRPAQIRWLLCYFCIGLQTDIPILEALYNCFPYTQQFLHCIVSSNEIDLLDRFRSCMQAYPTFKDISGNECYFRDHLVSWLDAEAGFLEVRLTHDYQTCDFAWTKKVKTSTLKCWFGWILSHQCRDLRKCSCHWSSCKDKLTYHWGNKSEQGKSLRKVSLHLPRGRIFSSTLIDHLTTLENQIRADYMDPTALFSEATKKQMLTL